jgi:hypothetical protein
MIPRPRRAKQSHVTRAEFDGVIKLLNERGEIINAIRHELRVQFTRIAQLQQELDVVKEKYARNAL